MSADLGGWDVSKITSLSASFYEATNFVGRGIEQWITTSVTSLSYAFFGAGSVNADMTNWDVSMVTDMSYMFHNAVKFAGRGLGTWSTGLVTDLHFTFNGAARFVGTGLDKWRTGSVTSLHYTFYCAGSMNVDLSNWNIGSVSTMKNTFTGATSLTSCNKRKIADAWASSDIFIATSYATDWTDTTCAITSTPSPGSTIKEAPGEGGCTSWRWIGKSAGNDYWCNTNCPLGHCPAKDCQCKTPPPTTPTPSTSLPQTPPTTPSPSTTTSPPAPTHQAPSPSTTGTTPSPSADSSGVVGATPSSTSDKYNNVPSRCWADLLLSVPAAMSSPSLSAAYPASTEANTQRAEQLSVRINAATYGKRGGNQAAFEPLEGLFLATGRGGELATLVVSNSSECAQFTDVVVTITVGGKVADNVNRSADGLRVTVKLPPYGGKEGGGQKSIRVLGYANGGRASEVLAWSCPPSCPPGHESSAVSPLRKDVGGITYVRRCAAGSNTSKALSATPEPGEDDPSSALCAKAMNGLVPFVTDPRSCLDPERARSAPCAYGGGNNCTCCPANARCPGGARTWPKRG